MTQGKSLGNRVKVLREYPNTSASLWKVEESKESHACVARATSNKGKSYQQTVSNPENTALKEKQRNQHSLPDERKQYLITN